MILASLLLAAETLVTSVPTIEIKPLTSWRREAEVSIGGAYVPFGGFTCVLFDKDGKRCPLRGGSPVTASVTNIGEKTVWRLSRPIGADLGRNQVDSNAVARVDFLLVCEGARLDVTATVTPLPGSNLFAGHNGASRFAMWLIPGAREAMIGYTVDGTYPNGEHLFKRIQKGYIRERDAISDSFVNLKLETPKGVFTFAPEKGVRMDLSRYSECGIELYASTMSAFEDRGWALQPWTKPVVLKLTLKRNYCN